MSTKLEQLLDLIINEETEKANELFHAIVVETSKEIYENLIAEEDDENNTDEGAETDEDSVEEDANADDENQTDESIDLEDSYSMEEEEPSFDTTDDDATGELGQEVDAFGDDEGEEDESSEDQAIFDIKNAIAELEAAFAELEQAQGGEMGDDDMDAEFGDEEEMGDEDEDEGMMMGQPAFEGRRMTREYREMVKDGHGAEKKGAAEGGIAGANTGEKMPSGTNTKSAINANADRTKPTSGARPISSKDGSVGANTGTSPNAKTDASSLAGSVKGEFTKGVEKNISSSAKSSMKDGAALSKVPAGHGAERKGSGPGPVGSGTGDKAGQTSVAPIKPFLKHL